MRTKRNQFLATVYGQIFGWPLTEREARLWAITDVRDIIDITDIVEAHGKRQPVKVRQEREKISKKKYKQAVEVAGMLKKIPTVAAVFLTGSVAVGNASKNSDIDLMIITRPNTLWLTRMMVVLFLKWKKIYKHTICPNIFLDTNHLEIAEKNLYTAHEVLQAKCLFDRGNINFLWLKSNVWTKEYLPRAYKYYAHKKKPSPKYTIHNTLYILLELVAFGFQYLFMKRKITNERVGWGFAFFHPRQLANDVERKFSKALRSLATGS